MPLLGSRLEDALLFQLLSYGKSHFRFLLFDRLLLTCLAVLDDLEPKDLRHEFLTFEERREIGIGLTFK